MAGFMSLETEWPMACRKFICHFRVIVKVSQYIRPSGGCIFEISNVKPALGLINALKHFLVINGTISAGVG